MCIVYFYILIKKMPSIKEIFSLADWKGLKKPLILKDKDYYSKLK